MGSTKPKIHSFFNRYNYIFLLSIDEPGNKDVTSNLHSFLNANKLYLLKSKKTQVIHNIKSKSLASFKEFCSGNVVSVGTNNLSSAVFFYLKFINNVDGSNFLCCFAFKRMVNLQIYQIICRAYNLMPRVSVFNLVFFLSKTFRMHLIIILRLIAYKKNSMLLSKLFLNTH